MTTYSDYLAIQDLERQADRLGFELTASDHLYQGIRHMALRPKKVDDPADEPLPVYARDAQLFVGTIEELRASLDGWEKAHQYLYMLRAASSKRVKRAEQDVRNEKLLKILEQKQLT